jgi:hypothetical protein
MAEAEAAPSTTVALPLDTSTVKLTANLSEDKVSMQRRKIRADLKRFIVKHRHDGR